VEDDQAGVAAGEPVAEGAGRAPEAALRVEGADQREMLITGPLEPEGAIRGRSRLGEVLPDDQVVVAGIDGVQQPSAEPAQ
jgi:hypothetical protein